VQSYNGMNTLSNSKYLVVSSTMQGLCLDSNEREKTMNRDLVFTADGDIIQSSIAFQSAKKSLIGREVLIPKWEVELLLASRGRNEVH